MKFDTDNDYINIKGELIAIDEVDSINREDLLEAFSKFAPRFSNQSEHVKGLIFSFTLIIFFTIIIGLLQ